ncbi:luciferase family protein [Leifsonia sp. LS-T14]|uniref:luciferase domain-containing protein n=1 Tax=unclassified Leifsonia TaxID=2663824 RepID=UPI0035A5B489
MSEGRSAVSPADSRALIVYDRDTPAVPSATLAPGAPVEPVHLHGVQDTSLHLVLPPVQGRQVCANGWGIPHQYGDFGTELLIFGPRDAAELAVVLELIEASIRYARGSDEGRPDSPLR